MNEEIPTPVNDPTGSPTGPGNPPVNADQPATPVEPDPENDDDEGTQD